MKRCPFCHPEGALLGNELAFVIRDLYPVSPGHLLIIPRRHLATWFDADTRERSALIDLADHAKAWLDEHHRPDGYNLGVNVGEAAGQTVMHLHLHLIPRYRGDCAEPTGGVRGVIPGKQWYPTEGDGS